MKLVIQVVVGDEGAEESIVVGTIERDEVLQASTLGLRLAESKALLEGLQREIVQRQFRAHWQRQRVCDACGVPRAIKDYHPIRFRRLFGSIVLRMPRV